MLGSEQARNPAPPGQVYRGLTSHVTAGLQTKLVAAATLPSPSPGRRISLAISAVLTWSWWQRPATAQGNYNNLLNMLFSLA